MNKIVFTFVLISMLFVQISFAQEQDLTEKIDVEILMGTSGYYGNTISFMDWNNDGKIDILYGYGEY